MDQIVDHRDGEDEHTQQQQALVGAGAERDQVVRHPLPPGLGAHLRVGGRQFLFKEELLRAGSVDVLVREVPVLVMSPSVRLHQEIQRD